jgi:hypothetical protein
LTANGQKQAVLLSVEAFAYLIGMRAYQKRDLMPADEFHQAFHHALVAAGYDSREKILNLIHEVKQEMIEDRERMPSSPAQ